MEKFLAVSLFVCFISGFASADIFGTGANQFEIDFVPISGDNGDLGSWSAGTDYTFSGVNHGDYRMGTYEITNAQFAKFAANNPYFTEADVPANEASWYEAAQFVNYLNTSTGNPVAYNFNGGTFSMWQSGDIGYDASNPCRNSNAKYFLPTENEWVKAAYWNGTSLQTYATKAGESLTQGDGSSGTGWNYYDDGYVFDPAGPWTVGSGSEELNGTYDMMGNVWEWTESPYFSGDFSSYSYCATRGGGFGVSSTLRSSFRDYQEPDFEFYGVGFRVASVPEPCSLVLLGLGGLLIRKRK